MEDCYYYYYYDYYDDYYYYYCYYYSYCHYHCHCVCYDDDDYYYYHHYCLAAASTAATTTTTGGFLAFDSPFTIPSPLSYQSALIGFEATAAPKSDRATPSSNKKTKAPSVSQRLQTPLT